MDLVCSEVAESISLISPAVCPTASTMFASAFWLLFRSPADRPLAGLALVIQTLAALEYGVAVLADAAETDRHLFMFHVATEISILLFIPLVLRIYARHRIRGSGEPRETIAVAGQAV